MKKRLSVILSIAFMLLILSFLFAVYADDVGSGEDMVFVFPESIVEIEEGAFEGTSVKKIVFPNGLLSIGDNAFKDTVSLTDVYIPDTTEYISDSAFLNADGLVIYGIKGSYAEAWAQKSHIPFEVCDIWNVIIENRQSNDFQRESVATYIKTENPDISIAKHERDKAEKESGRPQDRPELNPIDYRFP